MQGSPPTPRRASPASSPTGPQAAAQVVEEHLERLPMGGQMRMKLAALVVVAAAGFAAPRRVGARTRPQAQVAQALSFTLKWNRTMNDAGQADRAVVADGREPRRQARGGRRRPRRVRLRVPPLRRHERPGLAGQGARRGRLRSVGRRRSTRAAATPCTSARARVALRWSAAIRRSARPARSSGSAPSTIRPTDPYPHNGVMSSMAVGNLQGRLAVVGGSMGQVQYAMDARTGAVLPGFPWFQADDNFTTPALADVNGDGRNEIIEGGDQSPGISYGTVYKKGGHMRVLRDTGYYGHSQPNAGLICEKTPNQTMPSSPAVGRFLGRRRPGRGRSAPATAGSGASDTNRRLRDQRGELCIVVVPDARRPDGRGAGARERAGRRQAARRRRHDAVPTATAPSTS